MLQRELPDELMQIVEDQLVRSEILQCRYFLTLQDGTMPGQVFGETQKQFFFAVRFFSRAMAALAARITDSTSRMPLIHNLSDEHGLADIDESHEHQDCCHAPFQPALAHDRTFVVFLQRLGIPGTEISKLREGSPVRAFNLALWAACAIEYPTFAFACLGAIEFAFAEISAIIGTCVVNRGWMDRDELIHYKLHAEIDKRHASDFFRVIKNDRTRKDADSDRIEAGLCLGFYIFKRLYDDLLVEASHGCNS